MSGASFVEYKGLSVEWNQSVSSTQRQVDIWVSVAPVASRSTRLTASMLSALPPSSSYPARKQTSAGWIGEDGASTESAPTSACAGAFVEVRVLEHSSTGECALAHLPFLTISGSLRPSISAIISSLSEAIVSVRDSRMTVIKLSHWSYRTTLSCGAQ